MAATISAGMTSLFSLLAAAGVITVEGVDAWNLIDAALLAGLAYGVWRRSRVCAALLLVYGVASEVLFAFDQTARFSLLRIVFIYFYLRGAIQIFRDHRSATAPEPAKA
jgi:serine/threonine-protein kinase